MEADHVLHEGYIIGQVPGHYLMQRIPLSRFMAGATFLWTLIVFLHCTASSYGGLIALRFFLGMVEAPVVPAIEITLGMFFVPATQGILQPLFWISCMGAPVPAGFIAYGLLYIHSTILPWKFFMIITGSMTFVSSLLLFFGMWPTLCTSSVLIRTLFFPSQLLTILVAFVYPNNPAEARFLTIPERIHLVHRIHTATTSSIEHRQLKKYQLLEALRDPVSWLFGLQAFTLMISNNIAYQQNLLFVSLGVSNLGSTLVSAASGGFSVACCIAATLFLRYIPLRKAFVSLPLHISTEDFARPVLTTLV